MLESLFKFINFLHIPVSLQLPAHTISTGKASEDVREKDVTQQSTQTVSLSKPTRPFKKRKQARLLKSTFHVCYDYCKKTNQKGFFVSQAEIM